MRIVIADDHPVTRAGVRTLVEQLAPDPEIIECDDYRTLFTLAEIDNRPELFVVDLHMPDGGCAEVISKLVKVAGTSRVVVMSSDAAADGIIAVLESGAHGFVPKTLAPEAFVNAFKLVLSGVRYIPDVVLFGRDGQEAPAGLSPREADLLHRLSLGHTNKEIARAVELQEATIKMAFMALFRKIGARNRADAVRIAFKNGWITAD